MSHLQQILTIKTTLEQHIVGQKQFIHKLFIALLADGHILVEGPPGLAKTKAIRELGELIEADFHRIQFTPDLLPADLTGTEIYRPQDGSFQFQQGPLFHNLILADEINRAPAKVQSALLEAMAERQITVGRETYALADLFLVMATQNPIEQEGTYPLPEAQLDRFLLHIKVDYPDGETEKQILQLNRNEAKQQDSRADIHHSDKLSQQAIFEARQEILELHISESVEAYLIAIIMATRRPEKLDSELAGWIDYGVSPRASIALERCARTHAWLKGQDYVTPADIQAVCHDVLRHRILLSFEAEANAIDSDQCVDKILSLIAIP